MQKHNNWKRRLWQQRLHIMLIVRNRELLHKRLRQLRQLRVAIRYSHYISITITQCIRKCYCFIVLVFILFFLFLIFFLISKTSTPISLIEEIVFHRQVLAIREHQLMDHTMNHSNQMRCIINHTRFVILIFLISYLLSIISFSFFISSLTILFDLFLNLM